MIAPRRVGRLLGITAIVGGLAASCAALGLPAGARTPQAAMVMPRSGGAAGDEAAFLQSINDVRASKGLAALRVDGRLVPVARSWAGQMSSSSTLAHNPDLVNQIPSDWATAGENVGVGPNEPDIAQAFIKSPEHYVNIVRSTYTNIGIGVVYGSDGRVWVTEDFASYSGGPSAAPQPPAARPVASGSDSRPGTATTRAPAPTVPAISTPTRASAALPSTTSTSTTSTTASAPPVPDVDSLVRRLDGLDANS